MGRTMVYPYTLGAMIKAFPLKYHLDKSWVFKVKLRQKISTKLKVLSMCPKRWRNAEMILNKSHFQSYALGLVLTTPIFVKITNVFPAEANVWSPIPERAKSDH